MIELSAVSNKAMSHKNKSSSKEAGASTAFDDLIKLSGESKEGEGTDKEQGLTPPFLLIYPTAHPLLSPLSDKGVPVIAQNTPILPGATVTENLAGNNQQELSQMAEQLIPQGKSREGSAMNAAKLEQAIPHGSAAINIIIPEQGAKQAVNLTEIAVTQKDTSQQGFPAAAGPETGEQGAVKQAQPATASVSPLKEQQGALQTGTLDEAMNVEQVLDADPQLREQMREQSADSNLNQQESGGFDDGAANPQLAGTSAATRNTDFNPVQNMLNSNGKLVFETPVRAAQFDSDISKLLQSVIDVQSMNDGVEATFSLNPQHLGKVDVKISILDGSVVAEFLTSTLSGKDLLESQVQVLRTALEQQGFQVDKINFTQQQANLNGAFSQKGDSQARQQGQQESKKRDGQAAYIQEDEYWDANADHGGISRINTTA